jgi:hypothetical protein
MAKKKATYVSKYNQLRIVLESAYEKEVNGRFQTVPGRSVHFDGGVFETDDEELQEELEARSEFERDIFIRVDKDPTKEREDLMEDLEAREARIKAKEEELGIKEKQIDRDTSDAGDEGGEEDTDEEAFSDTPEDDGLDGLLMADYIQLAEDNDVDLSDASNNEERIDALREAGVTYSQDE